jgi:hypothetical protein
MVDVNVFVIQEDLYCNGIVIYHSQMKCGVSSVVSNFNIESRVFQKNSQNLALLIFEGCQDWRLGFRTPAIDINIVSKK